MNEHNPTSKARPWVRFGLIALGVPNLLTGLWAVLAPEGWYNSFPGFGPDLIAAEPPYNAHLATDAGAGLLASGLVLLVAAWLADRRSAQLALVAFSAFAVPHAAYHVLHESPGLTSGENIQSAGMLGFAAVAAIVLFAASTRTPAAAKAS